MIRKTQLSFSCPECGETVPFPLEEAGGESLTLFCKGCNTPFLFEEDPLLRQIRKLLALSKAVKEAEEILSQTSVAVKVGDKEVKVPYKLLLTRLNTSLELTLKGRKIVLTFRTEPLT